MDANDLSHYPPAVAALLTPPRLPELGPGTPNAATLAALRALTPETVAPGFRDRSMVLACLSGLWLYHDFLDESHRISQDLPGPEGAYWHAIMHRREPDAWNSKYWFRQVVQHPVVTQLVERAPSLGYAYRTPEEFVDFCEGARGTGSADEGLAKRVQLLEWELLFDWCYRQAFTG